VAYKGPSGRMGAPDNPDDSVRLEAGDLAIYVARDIWDGLKPGQSKLLVAVGSYGRFWLHLRPTLPLGT
jgi:hypothetical protein